MSAGKVADLSNRYRGALLGLAAGDALGTALEFKPPGSFEPLEDMVGGGPFRLKPGQWTDDTSLALCLAESLVECGGFDAVDQMKRYVRWCREGYLSSTGKCFDIGGTTADALTQFERTGNPISGPTDAHSAGNGSIMRLAPKIAEVASGSFRCRQPPEIRETGYVVQSLEAALWAFAKGDSFREGVLLAVNLGNDADTTGAVYGQLAGAHYGVEGIPEEWRAKLAMRERIEELADGLLSGVTDTNPTFDT